MDETCMVQSTSSLQGPQMRQFSYRNVANMDIRGMYVEMEQDSKVGCSA